ncbi:anti-sigma factor family protein [Rhodohalobacter sp. 614A]|uniref:anti-sigma factor family protein n=1 Tax=Rhodohalobacter sp. 614A TaxID=2908649 RepID=UPI001F3B226C|nr:hypothetical protein [Rhodohalobacter sp. 614A]
MDDQNIKNLFMDYLYDEMTDEQKAEFEKKLDKNPDLKKEFEELKSTNQLLQKVPMETPSLKLVMMAPEHDQKEKIKESSNKNFLKKYPGLTTVLAAAACLLIILMGAAFTGLNVGQTDQGFYMTFGEAQNLQPEIIQQGLSEQEVRDMINQIRQENSLLLASMIEKVQEQQNDQLEEAINVLTDYYDQRRQQDLRLISQGIAQLEEDTYHRLRQTDEALGDLIYALSYQSTQSTEE